MGACIDIRIIKAQGVDVAAEISSDAIGCSSALVSVPLAVDTAIAKGMQIEATGIRDNLKITARLLCAVTDIAAWLRVTPDEIQWITEDKGATFEVVSNLDWVVIARRQSHADFGSDFGSDFAIMLIDFNSDFNSDFASLTTE